MKIRTLKYDTVATLLVHIHITCFIVLFVEDGLLLCKKYSICGCI
jgi:hypothetical protein